LYNLDTKNSSNLSIFGSGYTSTDSLFLFSAHCAVLGAGFLVNRRWGQRLERRNKKNSQYVKPLPHFLWKMGDFEVFNKTGDYCKLMNKRLNEEVIFSD